MLKIFIQGLKNGEYPIEAQCEARAVMTDYEEFIDNITVKGSMKILGNRYTLDFTAECDAKLTCDISLNEYIEKVSCNIKLSYLADEELFRFGQGSDIANAEARILHPDDKFLDITEEVREELAVNLPMKRISPEYRDKSLVELYPDIVVEKNTAPIEDDRWKDLKKIRFN